MSKWQELQREARSLTDRPGPNRASMVAFAIPDNANYHEGGAGITYYHKGVVVGG